MRTAWGAAAALLAGGCGPENLPKGHGARGQPLKALSQGQDSFERLYKLTPPQQLRFDAMHRKFGQVAAVRTGLEPDAQRRLDAVKANWDGVVFAVPSENRRWDFGAYFDTDAGVLAIAFVADSAPDHARSLMSLVRGGLLKGKRIEMDGRALRFGAAAPGRSTFSLPRIPTPLVPATAVYAEPAGDRDAGESFLIATATRLDLADRATLVGRVTSPNLLDIVDAVRKKGFVTIKSVTISPSYRALFNSNGEVLLSRLDRSGNIELSDAAMFAQAAASAGLSGDRGADNSTWAPRPGLAPLEALLAKPPPPR